MITPGRNLLVHYYSPGPVVQPTDRARRPLADGLGESSFARGFRGRGLLEQPAAPGPENGLFRPVLWVTGRNGNVGAVLMQPRLR